MSFDRRAEANDTGEQADIATGESCFISGEPRFQGIETGLPGRSESKVSDGLLMTNNN